jgi:LysR family transcriptional regulator for bpeEF and oprC
MTASMGRFNIKICLEDFGLVQLAEKVVSEPLREGRLVEVLAD